VDTNKRDKYNAAVQFYINEIRTLGERNNAFLIGQSILFVAFVALLTNSGIFPKMIAFIVMGISLVGAAFCILYHRSGKTGAYTALRWREYMLYIETNESNTPWNWFYKDGGKCYNCLLHRSPLPNTWITTPAIFSVIWALVSLYARTRLYTRGDLWTKNLILSLEKTQLISNIVLGVTCLVCLIILVGFICWCCKKK
jgi:hypothetical protein